jgi:hypothetical protein
MTLRPMLLVAVVAALTAATPAAAQQPCPTCTQAVTLNVQVPTVMRLVLDAPTTLVATASEDSYDRGYETTAGPTATVKSNVPWRLDISTTQETWTPTGAGARADKPAADLAWSASPDGRYAPIGTTPAVAATGRPGKSRVPLTYRTNFSYEKDSPGSYQIVVKLTLAAS